MSRKFLHTHASAVPVLKNSVETACSLRFTASSTLSFGVCGFPYPLYDWYMGNLSNAQDNKLGSVLDDRIVLITIFCPLPPIDETVWTAVFQLLMSAEAAVCVVKSELEPRLNP